MENKELYKTEIKGKVEDVIVKDEGVEIITDQVKVEISTHHDSDCCEHVYGDFSIFKYYKEGIVGKPINEIVIKSVSGMGFLIVFNGVQKVFIPCYNFQNGYYSSNLELVLKKGEIETKIGISDLVEDHIN